MHLFYFAGQWMTQARIEPHQIPFGPLHFWVVQSDQWRKIQRVCRRLGCHGRSVNQRKVCIEEGKQIVEKLYAVELRARRTSLVVYKHISYIQSFAFMCAW